MVTFIRQNKHFVDDDLLLFFINFNDWLNFHDTNARLSVGCLFPCICVLLFVQAHDDGFIPMSSRIARVKVMSI